MTDKAAQADIDLLTALNRDYIASVQGGDVRRFEEILADDFLCSNPDGTLIDRAQFLQQTALPVTISGLVAENVQIRLMAMSPSSMPARATSRRPESCAKGRYTDVWARRGGEWLAVSAHVTRWGAAPHRPCIAHGARLGGWIRANSGKQLARSKSCFGTPAVATITTPP
jgi:ketosteroid isomerase-like protein